MGKNSSVKYIFILLWFSCTFIIALLIFSRGLLLHRDVLPHEVSCIRDDFTACVDDYANDTNLKRCLRFYNNSLTHQQYCRPSNFKVILLIIDALRHDFAKYDGEIKNPLPYQNKLTIIRDMLEIRPHNSKLFKFVADPPTTTMQRIKGLTTGSLPTFVDIGSNFASSEINESNIIDLLNQEFKKAVFLGDDTWTKLYPNRFTRSFPFDSFNVWDLDTVDYGITKNLFSELGKSDWHLLVAHFLGVDHCGHRYGPYHPEMERKLTEMNDVIKNIVKELADRPDVLLFVIGDHGMTNTGDHGGETENEITSALFAYSPVHRLYNASLALKDSVNQVDLVPTLSSILGLPIPFSNTGSVILECVPISLVGSVFSVAFLLWKNVEQISNYVKEYSLKNSQFQATNRLELFEQNYSNLRKIWYGINEGDLANFVNEYDSFMKTVLNMCQEAWVQFGYWSIACGLVFMTLTITLCAAIANTLTTFNTPSARLVSTSCSALLAGSIIAAIFVSRVFVVDETLTVLILIESVSVIGTSWLCFRLRRRCVDVVYDKRKNVAHIFVFVYCAFSFVGFFSNSFILEEPSVLLFLFVTCICTLIVNFYSTRFLAASATATATVAENERQISYRYFYSRKDDSIFVPVIAICFMYRTVFRYVKCREEQADCRNSEEDAAAAYDASSCLVAVISQTLIIAAFRRMIYRRRIRVLDGRLKCTAFEYVPVVGVIFMAIYWICEITFINVQKEFTYLDKIPGILLIACIITICVLFVSPPRFGYRRLRFEDDDDDERGRSSTFDNLSTLGASFANVTTFCYLISSILLGQLYTLPAAFMTASLWLLTFLLNTVRRESKLLENHVPWSYAMLWGFSSVYWFYVTGHNATFSGVKWNAAYLIQKDIGNNLIVPGLLVTMNTFASYVIHGILLPLLAVSPYIFRQIHREFLTFQNESTTSSNKEHAFANETRTLHEAFLLILKYYVFFSIRLLAIMLSTALHCRHLMMWKVFAPKFMFESIAFVITILSTMIGFLFVARISHNNENLANYPSDRLDAKERLEKLIT